MYNICTELIPLSIKGPVDDSEDAGSVEQIPPSQRVSQESHSDHSDGDHSDGGPSDGYHSDDSDGLLEASSRQGSE